MDQKTRRHILASSAATCVAEIITLPICTLKTNFQNQDKSTISKVASEIWHQRGIKGFYNASPWAISSQTLSTALKYTGYRKLNDRIDNTLIAGALSGFFSSLITHPIDVIKIHFQMHTSFLLELKKYGPSLFYRGYSKTLGKAVIGSSLFYPLYDRFRQMGGNPFVASLGSAIISTTVMQPLDYMKIRQAYGLPFFTGRNPRPYFKGLSLNLFRVIPHFMITMTLIEFFEGF